MSWFRNEDRYGALKEGGSLPHKDELEIESVPPQFKHEKEKVNRVRKIFNDTWKEEAEDLYESVYHGKPRRTSKGTEAVLDTTRSQLAETKNFWNILKTHQRQNMVEYYAGEPPMEIWKKILPLEPPSKRIFPHLTPETRKQLNFPTHRSMKDFEGYLSQIRSYVDLNPPSELIGVEMDPDPITRKIRHSEITVIARNRMSNEKRNPPPVNKPRYHIHGIKEDIWMDAAQCMARKLNKLDDSISLTITQVPIRHWKAHLGTQSLRTQHSNVDFESGSTVYVTQGRPDSFQGMDSMGGVWEFANHLKNKYDIDIDPCWRKVSSTKASVANKLRMTE